MTRRRKPPRDSADFALARTFGLAGLFIGWVVVSFEAYDYFNTQRGALDVPARADVRLEQIDRKDVKTRIAENDLRLARSARVALSITWGLYAIALIALGLRLPSQPLRWAALALFGVTLLKVVLFDMERLSGLYRVAAFFGLSLMMGAAAWAYQKVKLSLLAEHEEANDASPI